VTVPLEKFVCEVSHNCPENCTCIKRPSDLSFTVSCPPGTQDQLPKVLPDPNYPPPRTAKFHLNYSGSNIQTLEFRPYLTNTTWIDMSKSKLHSIPHDTWRTLSKMDHVDLSGNQLTVLPTFLASQNITFRWLAVYDNPLRCNCEDKWIRRWLESLGQALFVPRYQPPAVCGSPDRLQNRSILHVNDDDFCRNSNDEKNANDELARYIIEVSEILATLVATILTVCVIVSSTCTWTETHLVTSCYLLTYKCLTKCYKLRCVRLLLDYTFRWQR